jgi:hypothetical protein
MVFTLGGFSDGTWALGRAPEPIEVIHPDGTAEIRPQTIVFDIRIDKNKWDAFIAELQAQTPPPNPSPEDSPSTVLKIFSTILDMTPLIGNVKLGIEAIIGHDIITWEELDPLLGWLRSRRTDQKARHDRLLMHVQATAPLNDRLHHRLLSSEGDRNAAAPHAPHALSGGLHRDSDLANSSFDRVAHCPRR